MPNVTIDPAKTTKFELESAPANPEDPSDEAGWVLLRPLPYGMKLKRRDNASKMSMKAQTGKKAQQGGDIELQSYQEWAVSFDFGYCIVDHNLTDSQGVKLDFTKRLTFQSLDPKVGSEIEKHINSLNEDDEGDMEDFLPQQNISSSIESTDSSSTE